MYDNIDLTLSSEHCPNTDLISEIPNHLTRITNQGESDYGQYVNGYLGSLYVSISDTRVKLSKNSICKYYLGDNFKTLSKGDTKRAIEKISDGLHLPFKLSNVTRIDVAQNLIMQHPETVYYSYLGEDQYYNRLPQPNGLYYNNQLRQKLFYGKEHEQKVKGNTIPELYKERNVLRFEVRYRKRLREQFNVSELPANLLYNEKFYIELTNKWRQEYLSIQKINNKLGNMKPTGSKKEFFDNLALHTILEMGQANVLNLMKEWQQMGEIDKKQAYDIRKAIKKLASRPICENGNELINELNRKVKEASRYL